MTSCLTARARVMYVIMISFRSSKHERASAELLQKSQLSISWMLSQVHSESVLNQKDTKYNFKFLFLVISQFGAHWRIRMTGQILPFLNMAQSFKYMPDGRSLVNTKTEFLHLAECFKRRISLYRYEYINSNEKSNKYKSSLLW